MNYFWANRASVHGSHIGVHKQRNSFSWKMISILMQIFSMVWEHLCDAVKPLYFIFVDQNKGFSQA